MFVMSHTSKLERSWAVRRNLESLGPILKLKFNWDNNTLGLFTFQSKTNKGILGNSSYYDASTDLSLWIWLMDDDCN